MPALPQREEILRRYLGPFAERVSAGALAAATGGASGADLRELVRRAVLAYGEELDTAALHRLAREGGWAAPETGLYL